MRYDQEYPVFKTRFYVVNPAWIGKLMTYEIIEGPFKTLRAAMDSPDYRKGYTFAVRGVKILQKETWWWKAI